MKFKIFGGGASAVLTFADNFHRTDQPSMLGDAWICAPGAGSTIVGGSNLAASINVAGGSQATFSICSSNGANVIYCWPIPLTWNILNALQQEAQCRYISDNSGGVNGAFNGPFVLGNVNKDSCYFI